MYAYFRRARNNRDGECLYNFYVGTSSRRTEEGNTICYELLLHCFKYLMGLGYEHF